MKAKCFAKELIIKDFKAVNGYLENFQDHNIVEEILQNSSAFGKNCLQYIFSIKFEILKSEES